MTMTLMRTTNNKTNFYSSHIDQKSHVTIGALTLRNLDFWSSFGIPCFCFLDLLSPQVIRVTPIYHTSPFLFSISTKWPCEQISSDACALPKESTSKCETVTICLMTLLTSSACIQTLALRTLTPCDVTIVVL